LLDGLEQTGTAPTLRLAVRFMLLTGVRKGEFIGATWSEVDWERAQWSIPTEFMQQIDRDGRAVVGDRVAKPAIQLLINAGLDPEDIDPTATWRQWT
jgi:integrase